MNKAATGLQKIMKLSTQMSGFMNKNQASRIEITKEMFH